MILELISHLGSDPRGTLRPIWCTTGALHSVSGVNCKIPISSICGNLKRIDLVTFSGTHPFRTLELSVVELE